MGWVSREGWACGGGQGTATPGCEGAFLRGVVWGVVGLLMGGGVQTVKIRPEASCYLMKKGPSSMKCYCFWPRAITGRGEYPRRTRGNEQGLRFPPGTYGLSCSKNISKKLQTKGSCANERFPYSSFWVLIVIEFASIGFMALKSVSVCFAVFC